MKKAIAILILVIIGLILFLRSNPNAGSDYKSIAYEVSGDRVILSPQGPFSFFGNEIRKDLDGDGAQDVAFLFTRKAGDVVDYFVVAAYAEGSNYVGSKAVMIGTDIHPQTTTSGPDKSIYVNFATASSSQAKSVRVILDRSTDRFGEIVEGFEGESN